MQEDMVAYYCRALASRGVGGDGAELVYMVACFHMGAYINK